jgi:hypothetical protein
MMKIGQVGPQVFSDGSEAPLRLGKQGDQIVSELHGRYTEAVMRGRVFTANPAASITPPATFTNTAATFTLYNPQSSGVMLSVLEFLAMFTAPPAGAVVLAWMANLLPTTSPPGSTTAVTVRNCLLGAAGNSAAFVYSVATLNAAPVMVRPAGSIVAAGAITPPCIKDEIAGALVLLPGTSISLNSNAAVSILPSITWEEIPI